MIQFHIIKNKKIAEISALNKKIKTTDDIMEFFGDCYANDVLGVIIAKYHFDNSFFDLKTGIAGDILQKFTNYNIKLAITGDFSNIESNSLKDFIRESNKRKFINFVTSTEKAIEAIIG